MVVNARNSCTTDREKEFKNKEEVVFDSRLFGDANSHDTKENSERRQTDDDENKHS